MNLSSKNGNTNQLPKVQSILKGVVLAGAIILAGIACQKDNSARVNNDINEQQKSSHASLVSVETDCECCASGTDSFTFVKSFASATLIGQYAPWTDTAVQLCENGAELIFEGQFRSFVRVNDGWNLGTISPSVTGTNFCTLIANPSFAQRCGNTGGSILSGYGPGTPLEGVIGANSTSAGVGDMGLGFYDYPTRGNPRIISDILLWKQCEGTGHCLSNDSTASIAYRLKIIAITPTRTSGTGVIPIVYSTKIVYSWVCLTTCSQ